MIEALTHHFDTVEQLQSELEAKVREALGEVTAQEILERFDELPAEIAEELEAYIKDNLLQPLTDESIKLLEDLDDDSESPPDEDEVHKVIALLLGTYVTQITNLATAALQDIKTQADLQLALGRDEQIVSDELTGSVAGIGKRWAGFGNALVASTDSFINSAAGAVVITNAEDDFTWITVHDGKVCPSCASRHGDSKAIDDWVQEGLPRTGWSVCGGRCRCMLIPTNTYEKAGKPGPLERKRR